MASLATATVNRPIACQIKHDREEKFKKARNGELTPEKEKKLLREIIDSKVADGVLMFEVPFCISEKAWEMSCCYLYEDNKTTICFLETTEEYQRAYQIKAAREEAFDKAQKGELSVEEERKLLIEIINSKVQDGVFLFCVPFYISDRAYEMVYSMLYSVYRSETRTKIIL